MSHKAAKSAFRKQYFQLSTGIKEDLGTLNTILYAEGLIGDNTRDKADVNETLKAIEGRLKLEEETFQAFISALEKITNGDLLVKKLRSCYEQELPTSVSTASAADVGGTLGIADLFQVKQCLKDVVHWKDLGLALGLFFPTLQKIDTAQRGVVNACMQEMLAAWLNKQDNVAKVGTPSWHTLKTALVNIGEKAVADSIN